MKELIFIGNQVTDYKDKQYVISTFIDVENYHILRGTNLSKSDKLVKGSKYLCDVDVKYSKKENNFIFFVTDAE